MWESLENEVRNSKLSKVATFQINLNIENSIENFQFQEIYIFRALYALSLSLGLPRGFRRCKMV